MSIANVPESVEHALLMDCLGDAQKELLSRTPENELGQFHYTLGADIRNRLGLWREDAKDLLAAIAGSDPTHPSVNDWGDSLSIDADGASALLLRTIRRRLLASSRG